MSQERVKNQSIAAAMICRLLTRIEYNTSGKQSIVAVNVKP